LKLPGLSTEVSEHLQHHFSEGEYRYPQSIHSSDPNELEKAFIIFESEGATEVYHSRKEAA